MALATAAIARGERLPSQSSRALAAKMAAAIITASLRVSSFMGFSSEDSRRKSENPGIAHRLPFDTSVTAPTGRWADHGDLLPRARSILLVHARTLAWL